MNVLFKNKKSDIQVSLLTLLEVVLAILIAGILIYLGVKLLGLFISRQDFDSTINNLEELSIRIKELIKDDKAVSQTTVYSITDNFILVGFSYDNKDIITTKCTNENILTSRPKSCQSKSCLCIYKNYNGKDFDDKGGVTVLRCKPFEENVIFLTPTSDSNFMGGISEWKIKAVPTTYYNLVLYGQCGIKNEWAVRQIQLEKYKEGENIFVIIKELPRATDTTIVDNLNEPSTEFP